MPATADLSGLHAVVTGAGRGIGAAIALELARRGAAVTLMGRDLAALEAQGARLAAEAGRRAETVVVDVTDEQRVSAAFEMARERSGEVTILVNNAGTADSAPFRRADEAHWQSMLDINLLGPVRCSREVVSGMVTARFGRIVTVASTAGLKGYAYVSAYCAAKHGVIGFTRALALELAATGVTVNAVCPGFADTDLTARTIERIVATTGRAPDEALREITRHNPQGRLIRPEEVASTVGWLCSPGNDAITGQAIVVAGGEIM